MAFHDTVGEIKRCPSAKHVLAESLSNELGIRDENGQHVAQFQRVNAAVTPAELGKRFVRCFAVDPGQVAEKWQAIGSRW